jgi:hypothetical protein
VPKRSRCSCVVCALRQKEVRAWPSVRKIACCRLNHCFALISSLIVLQALLTPFGMFVPKKTLCLVGISISNTSKSPRPFPATDSAHLNVSRSDLSNIFTARRPRHALLLWKERQRPPSSASITRTFSSSGVAACASPSSRRKLSIRLFMDTSECDSPKEHRATVRG